MEIPHKYFVSIPNAKYSCRVEDEICPTEGGSADYDLWLLGVQEAAGDPLTLHVMT